MVLWRNGELAHALVSDVKVTSIIVFRASIWAPITSAFAYLRHLAGSLGEPPADHQRPRNHPARLALRRRQAHSVDGD